MIKKVYRWLKPRVSKTHHIHYVEAVTKKGWITTRSGLTAVFPLQNPKDPDAYSLVAVRPNKKFRVRKRTADHFQRIQRAVNAGKFSLLRYDPQDGLRPYDPATEPNYSAKNKEPKQ